MERRTAAFIAAFLTSAAALFHGVPAHAAEGGASITHIEQTSGGVRVLVSVPLDAKVELGKVTATIGGTAATARAESAGTAQQAIRRTEVLAIDTSNSMKGEKFDAAKAAALQFLQTVPSDVYVGIVTFDGTVTTALEPTRDRKAATSVVDGLALSSGTKLYDGITAALTASGATGQRSVLVLSDGADVGSTTSLDDESAAVKKADVLLDAVSLAGGTGRAVDALSSLVAAGSGNLLSADPDQLRQAFADEAGALARQLLVTVKIPASVTSTSGSVDLRLPLAGGGALTAGAFDDSLQPAPGPRVGAASTGFTLPRTALYVGVVAIGFGLLAMFLVLLPKKRGPQSADERIRAYTAAASRHRAGGPRKAAEALAADAARGDDVLASAKSAAADLLHQNAGLEARIATRLEAAGSALKPAEWLLVHVGIVVLATLVGLVLGHGNLFVAFLFLAAGAVGPWVYLGLRRARRHKAFNEALPDTLQLLSGALSAGLSLAQAVDTVVHEGAEPLASEFKRALVETRLGVGLEDALDGIAERFTSEDFAWVVMAVRIQRQVGGNLAELFDTVAGTMRERQYIRRQVASLAAEGKLSAAVIGGLPPIFTLYLALTNRTYLTPLFTDTRGIIMVVFGIVWLSVGIFWMSKLVKVEV